MDDLDSSFFVLRALAGPMMAVVTMLVTITIFVPVVLYLVARWRAARSGETDNHLGLKVALHYFAISAFQLGLAGFTLLVWGLISSAPSETKSVFNRMAIGMIMPAVLVMAAHLSILKRTNDATSTGVRRLFAGYNLIVTGLLGFVALVIAFQALLAKGSSGEMGRVAGAMVLVYGTAWAIVGWRFGQLVLPGGPGAGTGASPMPPTTSSSSPSSAGPPPPSTPSAPTPPSATPSSTSGGLPSLGGGSFPPIEPKS